MPPSKGLREKLILAATDAIDRALAVGDGDTQGYRAYAANYFYSGDKDEMEVIRERRTGDVPDDYLGDSYLPGMMEDDLIFCGSDSDHLIIGIRWENWKGRVM